MPSAAVTEAREARSLAVRLDHANLFAMNAGLAPDTTRSEYPPGYEPGQTLGDIQQWRALAAYVDGRQA